jgi:hypothetical protein
MGVLAYWIKVMAYTLNTPNILIMKVMKKNIIALLIVSLFITISARAQAAVDFLVGRGIDASRLEAEGKGSSEPIDENNPEVNRRTEFIVLE